MTTVLRVVLLGFRNQGTGSMVYHTALSHSLHTDICLDNKIHQKPVFHQKSLLRWLPNTRRQETNNMKSTRSEIAQCEIAQWKPYSTCSHWESLWVHRGWRWVHYGWRFGYQCVV